MGHNWTSNFECHCVGWTEKDCFSWWAGSSCVDLLTLIGWIWITRQYKITVKTGHSPCGSTHPTGIQSIWQDHTRVFLEGVYQRRCDSTFWKKQHLDLLSENACVWMCTCMHIATVVTVCAFVSRKVWMFVYLTQKKGKHCLCFTGCNPCFSQLPLITFGSRKRPFHWMLALFSWIVTKEKKLYLILCYPELRNVFTNPNWPVKTWDGKMSLTATSRLIHGTVIGCVMFRCLVWEMSMKGRGVSPSKFTPQIFKTWMYFFIKY